MSVTNSNTPVVCPFSDMMSDACPGTVLPGLTDEQIDAHIRWHFFEAVRLGEIIDNGNGTFSIPEKKEAT